MHAVQPECQQHYLRSHPYKLNNINNYRKQDRGTTMRGILLNSLPKWPEHFKRKAPSSTRNLFGLYVCATQKLTGVFSKANRPTPILAQ